MSAPTKTHYVAGLLFDDDGDRVALIRKQKPAWMVGRLNAIGGKVEPGESAAAAMAREFREEAGVDIPAWTHTATLEGPDFHVEFFHMKCSERLARVRTIEAEEVSIYSVAAALGDGALMQNLKVMIALALDETGIIKPVTLHDAMRRPVAA